MVLPAEEPQGASAPVVLCGTIGEGDVLTFDHNAPRRHVVISVITERAISHGVSVTAMGAVDTVGIVIPEPAVLDQEIRGPLPYIIGDPCPALEMLRPTIAYDGVVSPAAHESFADLFVSIAVIVTLIIDGIEIDTLHPQITCLCL